MAVSREARCNATACEDRSYGIFKPSTSVPHGSPHSRRRKRASLCPPCQGLLRCSSHPGRRPAEGARCVPHPPHNHHGSARSPNVLCRTPSALDGDSRGPGVRALRPAHLDTRRNWIARFAETRLASGARKSKQGRRRRGQKVGSEEVWWRVRGAGQHLVQAKRHPLVPR